MKLYFLMKSVIFMYLNNCEDRVASHLSTCVKAFLNTTMLEVKVRVYVLDHLSRVRGHKVVGHGVMLR